MRCSLPAIDGALTGGGDLDDVATAVTRVAGAIFAGVLVARLLKREPEGAEVAPAAQPLSE